MGKTGNAMREFFGGTPGAVLVRLTVISVIVGVILSTLGLDPFDIIQSLQRLFTRIYELGFDAIEWVIRYFVLGAVIVFPVWLFARLWHSIGRTGTRKAPRSDQPPVKDH